MKKLTIMKIASCALACTMLAGTAAMTASAATSSAVSSSTSTQKEAAMKTALTAVKKRITIPEELSEFSYSTSQQRSMTKYSFHWKTPSDAKEYKYIDVNIVGNVIFSYNSNINSDDNYDDISFAKLSDSELLAKAKAHLKALNPDIYSKAEISIKRIDIKGNKASFSICHKENGEYVDSDGGNMTIDKNTGELISFNVSWLENASYASTAKAISEQEAQKAFQQLCTLEPRYAISTDWTTGEKSVALVYRPSFSGLIDAFTGKMSTYDVDRAKDNGSSLPFGSIYANPATGIFDEEVVECEEACDEGADDSVKFTEAELREIQTDEPLLTKDAITELMKKDKYIQLTSNFKLDSFNLYKNDKGEYFYNLYYRTNNNSTPVPTPIVYEDGTVEEVIEEPAEEDDFGYFRVNINAKTGDVKSFSKDGVFIAANKNLSDTKPYPVKKNAAIADAAIKHFYPDLCEKYKASESNTAPADFYMDSKQVKHYEQYRTYTYNRYENGVLVEGDSITLTMNNAGEVRSISITFTEGLKFPSVPKYDADKAFASLFKQQDIARSYIYYIKMDGTAKT
ncbi:MAG: YcdB/YcdC domain-containing protein, partial [Huintestinicola sp.]